MEPNSEIKLVRVSERTSVLAFKCVIRVLGLLAYLCICGIPTFDSESFELELSMHNGMPGGTSGSRFIQNP